MTFTYVPRNAVQRSRTTAGLMPIDQTKFNKVQGSLSGYNWHWSNATLSVLFRSNAKAIITNANHFDGSETLGPKTIEKYLLTDFSKTAPLSPQRHTMGCPLLSFNMLAATKTGILASDCFY